jgi:hypothetical protein
MEPVFPLFEIPQKIILLFIRVKEINKGPVGFRNIPPLASVPTVSAASACGLSGYAPVAYVPAASAPPSTFAPAVSAPPSTSASSASGTSVSASISETVSSAPFVFVDGSGKVLCVVDSPSVPSSSGKGIIF